MKIEANKMFLRKKRQFFTLLVIGSLSTLCLSTLLYDNISLTSIVNSMFLISLLFLTIGGTMFVIERGFFKSFAYYYRKYFSSINDNAIKVYPKHYTFKIKVPFIILGTLAFLLSLGLSFIL